MIQLHSCFLFLASAFIRRSDAAPGSSVLPHCKRETVVTGEITEENFDTAEIKILTTVQLNLALHETVCFNVNVRPSQNESDSSGTAEPKRGFAYNESLLYAIQYSSLEHHHPVREKYTFGIPHIRSHCVCDCSGGEDHCLVGHNYKNCTKGKACFTTYHPNKKPGGCPLSEDAELCCDVALSPYKDAEYMAMKLGQPDVVAVFTFKLFTKQGDTWSAASSNKIQIPLNKRQTFVLGEGQLKLEVSGDVPSQSLGSGVYFLGKDETQLRTGVPVNELREGSVEKLGWFRKTKGVWEVHNGWVKLQDAHHTSVQDCKAQKYKDSYNAAGYVAENYEAYGGDTFFNFHLGYHVEEVEPWINKSYFAPRKKESRTAIVSHRQSPSLTLDLFMNDRPVIKFYHHTSGFKDFTGSIQLDRHSNTFLNITFFSARGTQVGTVYKSTDRKVEDIAFSSYINSGGFTNHSTLLSIPSTVNSSRWVCFHPAGRPREEKCKWLQYFSKPLDWFVVPHQWSLNKGECDGCNEISVSNFVKYLNPSQWLDGITSGSEAIAMVFEVVLYLVVFLVIVAVSRKCICPFLKWTLCSGGDKSSGCKHTVNA